MCLVDTVALLQSAEVMPDLKFQIPTDRHSLPPDFCLPHFLLTAES
jgi:hypothetical protein